MTGEAGNTGFFICYYNRALIFNRVSKLVCVCFGFAFVSLKIGKKKKKNGTFSFQLIN